MAEEPTVSLVSEAAANAAERKARGAAKSAKTLQLRTRLLVAAFTAAAIVSGVSALARARTRVALDRLLENPTNAATRSLFDANDLQGNIGIVVLIAMIGTAIALSLWMYSALSHRHTQGAGSMSPATGAWSPFVPFANIVMPWLMYRDLQNSRPQAEASKGAGDPFAIAWWLTWLASLAVITFGPDANFPTSASARNSATADVAAALLLVMAAALGAIATLRLSAKILAGFDDPSETTAETLTSEHLGPLLAEKRKSPITSPLAGLTIAAGAAAFCVAIVAVAPATISSPSNNLIVAGDASESAGETFLLNEIPTGRCLPSSTDLSGEILALKAIDCSEPHKIEVVSRFELDNRAGSSYPGLVALDYEATRVCLDDLYDSHGLLFEVDAIVPVPILPLEQGWGLGDRGVTCLVELIDETSGSLASIDARISQRRALTGSFGPIVGQCVNDAGPPSLEVVPCDGPHEYEMMAVELDAAHTERHEGDDIEFETTAALCSGELFGDYVGVDYLDSIYDVAPLHTFEDVHDFTGRIHRACLLIVPAGTIGSLRGVAE